MQASTSWEYDRQTLRATYTTTGRSKVEYGASSWLPWISFSTFENLERSQHYAGPAITGQLCTTPVVTILAEAYLPSIETRTIKLSTIAIEKSLRTTETNPRHTSATHGAHQCTQKPNWREKAGDVWRKIFGDTKLATTPQFKPPWTDTGTHTFELARQKTGDTASDRIITMQTLENDRDSFDATIFTDGAATHCNAIGDSGIMFTTGPPIDPRIHRQSNLPAGYWSFQAKNKAVRTALVPENDSLHKARIISGSMSTLQRIPSQHPSQQATNSDENEILDALVSLTVRRCHLTFKWCPSNSVVRGNELADVKRRHNCGAGRRKSSL